MKGRRLFYKGDMYMEINEARELLKKYNQEQLLKYYDELNVVEQKDLLRQISEIDFSVLKLVEEKNIEQVRGVIEPINDLCSMEDIEARKDEFFAIGADAIRKCKVGAILLAGGQGTRLGSDKAKGMYNIGINKPLYIFEMLIKNLMEVVKATGVYVPLFVMTSDKNHEDTVSFFEEMNYFGYDKSFVWFFKQAMAASCDYDGKFYLEDKGKVSMSPNGNGGWFISLGKAGLLDKVKELGIEWLNVFAVDNVLQKIADPYFVGAVIDSKTVCGAKVVSKASPTEKVGALCLEDGRPSIVEYYELTDEMAHATGADGKLLYNYGVILNYLFNVEKLIEITKNELPLHIVEKKIPYIDADGNYVAPTEPNGYKFETLVLDMVHLMDNCLAYEVERSREFAPIKNKTGVDSVESARELLSKNGVIVE